MTEPNQPDGESGATQLHSNWWRLQAIFFEPSKLFEEINQRPNWLIPLIVLTLAAALSINYLVTSIGIDNVVQQQLNQSPQFQNADEQTRQQIIDRQTPIMNFFFRVGGLFAVVNVLLVSVAFLGVLILSGKEAKFSKVFSVTTYSYMAITLISTVLIMLVVSLAQDPSQLDLQNPIQSNLGALIDRKSSPALFSFASSLDIIYFYVIYLLSLGLSKTSRKLSLGGALLIVGGLWLVWVLGKTGLTAAFS